MNARVFLRGVVPAVLLILASSAARAVEPKAAPPLPKAWYTPAELLAELARRDGIRWALPETLAGRAFVGGEQTADALLDDACKQ